RVPQGEVDLELHELLSRRVETRWIRGEGAVLAFSLKQPHGTDPTELEGFHLIDGFPAPIREAEPRPVPEQPWELALEGLDVGLAQMQVNAFEAELDGRMEGAVDLKVAKRFGLPSLTLELAQAKVWRLGALVAEEVTGRAELSLD